MPVLPTKPIAVLTLAAATVQTTPTVLFGWSALRDDHEAIAFDLFNDDQADSVTFDIETSADGITPDSKYAWELALAAGEHAHLPVPNPQMPAKLSPRYWLLSAFKSTGAGTAQVRRGISGWRRQ